MDTNILIVDDDKEIVNLISIALQKNEGYIIYQAYNGEEAYRIIQEQIIHLVILDIMMPKLDGLELCSRVRKHRNTPIILVSAKTAAIDKVHGLMTGADDYITKPFNLFEMIMRVKALIRRAYFLNHHQEPDGVITIDTIRIDRNKYTVTVDDDKICLTAKEFDILYLLASHRGKIFGSEEIFQAVWKEQYYDSNNTVMVHISNIREKLNTVIGYKLIHTVWGVGYKIEE